MEQRGEFPRRFALIPNPCNSDSFADSRIILALIQRDERRRFVMSVPIALRVDFDASRVRGLAKKAKDGPQARRLLALAAIYDGATRSEAAKIGGVGLPLTACATANRRASPRSSTMFSAKPRG
jgi:hypothetical protein